MCGYIKQFRDVEFAHAWKITSSRWVFLTFNCAYTTFIPDSIDAYRRIVELEMNLETRLLYHSLSTQPIGFETFGKLWIDILDNLWENGTLSKIFGHPTNSANWAVSKKLIFENPPSSTKRASSVICDNLRENRTLLNTRSPEIRLEHCQSMRRISSKMRRQIEHRSRSQYFGIRLIRQIEQSSSVTCESPSNSKKSSTPKKTALGNSINLANETSSVTSEKSDSVEHLRQSTILESWALSKRS